MPWKSFATIFGASISVCPVTLPCPRNSLMHEVPKGGRTTRRRSSGRMTGCPRCHQQYTRSWLLLESGAWHRIADGDLCFLCLRTTCRSRMSLPRVVGVHTPPKLNIAPPSAPRKLKLCPYGPGCFRRNPDHFHDCFHPSLIPPSPPCIC